ncbi:hypothetical protein AVEN_181976-1 [Araneus ventricosus]|uniref:DUF5641 domain-containing protein n=1 Tax=Araneus ventricosus TaxID=182803 RepID=A0A4Y2JT33_ARAVE|nr:hypothetical protein AVEN_181976-1 [Araneus ventricosus]
MGNPKLPSKRHNLSPGDVVLIGSNNTKRLNLPLGRVIELFQSKDNIERVAKLLVSNEEIIRPIEQIYPLEMSSTKVSKGVPENMPTLLVIQTVCTLFRTSILHKLTERTIADYKDNTMWSKNCSCETNGHVDCANDIKLQSLE